MKPKAVYTTIGNRAGWFLFNWTAAQGGMLVAPTLASLIDRMRMETEAGR